MRILVMSDSHGHPDRLRQVFEAEPTANWYLFLGDGLRDFETVTGDYPDRHTMYVPGNCDLFSQMPLMREETFGTKRFFFTHGHFYDVKNGLYRLACAARERRADVVLFGHTHRPFHCVDDGLVMVNPGSVGQDGAYAVLELGRVGTAVTLCHL